MTQIILRGNEMTLAELEVNVVILPATFAITVSAIAEPEERVFAHTHLVDREPGDELPELTSLTRAALEAFKAAFAEQGGVIVEASA